MKLSSKYLCMRMKNYKSISTLNYNFDIYIYRNNVCDTKYQFIKIKTKDTSFKGKKCRLWVSQVNDGKINRP